MYQYQYISNILITQNRLVAEIPDLPPSWKITFDLKLTSHPKRCCTQYQQNCAEGILNMKHLAIKYTCASKRNFPFTRQNAVIRIAHVINGRFFVEDEKRKLSIGHWTKFEISQLTEEYSYNKKRLMFKVNIIKLKFLAHLAK